MKATVPGYNLAALCIFGVPWALGTVIGLSCRVIHTLPVFPTYPNPFTQDQVLTGFVMPYTIKALLGSGGVVGFFLLMFMALTSTVSSSMIAVSSILSYDLYKTYINPKATDKRVVSVSHLAVCFHGVFIAGFSLALNYGGANMNWINYFVPMLTCPGIMPLIFTLTWSRQTRLAAVVAPILGMGSGIAVWLGATYSMYGVLNMDTTQEQAPAIYGAITALFSPALYSVLISFYKPYVFDWRNFLRIELADDQSASPPSSSPNETESEHESSENDKHPTTSTRPTTDLDNVSSPFDAETLRLLHRWYRIAWIMFVTILLLTWVLWPLPLYRNWIFNKPFFAGWVTVAIIWQFVAFGGVVIFPLYDGRHAIAKGFRGLRGSIRSALRK